MGVREGYFAYWAEQDYCSRRVILKTAVSGESLARPHSEAHYLRPKILSMMERRAKGHYGVIAGICALLAAVQMMKKQRSAGLASGRRWGPGAWSFRIVN